MTAKFIICFLPLTFGYNFLLASGVGKENNRLRKEANRDLRGSSCESRRDYEATSDGDSDTPEDKKRLTHQQVIIVDCKKYYLNKLAHTFDYNFLLLSGVAKKISKKN